MSNSIIQIKNLSKSYILSHEGKENYTALRDVITQKAKKIFSFPKKIASFNRLSKEEFWALRNINLNIQEGERLGIIGRNGAGKSTLLKILSRITDPTNGEIKIRGRVASLLEVGTGFHPELTGRENIFLNGAILGMRQFEIKKHFDEIVDFAEVEQFLDTPVKRYSSGMYVRLAFAVAAHLEPEILIVDEVLAVGDVQFQKKCLGKMQQVSSDKGRTVIFVSHQMPTILNLCSRCILLRKGELIENGNPVSIISKYLSPDKNSHKLNLSETSNLRSKSLPYYILESFEFQNNNTEIEDLILEAKDNTVIELQVHINIQTLDSRLNFGYILKNEYGNEIVISMSTDMSEKDWIQYEVGSNKIKALIETTYLNEGRYAVYFISSIHAVRMLHVVEDDICLNFEIMGNRGNSPYWVGKKNSILAPFVPWKKVDNK